VRGIEFVGPRTPVTLSRGNPPARASGGERVDFDRRRAFGPDSRRCGGQSAAVELEEVVVAVIRRHSVRAAGSCPN
jgi:hypothetical protein